MYLCADFLSDSSVTSRLKVTLSSVTPHFFLYLAAILNLKAILIPDRVAPSQILFQSV